MSEDDDDESRTPVEEANGEELASGALTIVSAIERLKNSSYLPTNSFQDVTGGHVFDDYGLGGEETDESVDFEMERRDDGELLASMCSFNDSHFADLEASSHHGAQPPATGPLFDKKTHTTMTIRSRNKTKTIALENGGQTSTSSSSTSNESNAVLQRTVNELVSVVAAYDRFAQRVVRVNRELRDNERRVLTAQRDAALNDVITLQRSANELHARFESARALLERARSIEAAWQSKVPSLLSKYAALKRTAEEQLDKSYREADAYRSRTETELTELRSRLRRTEMERDSLREECSQRANEAAELHAICDELVAKLNETAS